VYNLNWHEIFCEVRKLKEASKNIRNGQAVWNAVAKFCPEITKQLAGSEFDCFYNDNNADKFMIKVTEMCTEKK